MASAFKTCVPRLVARSSPASLSGITASAARSFVRPSPIQTRVAAFHASKNLNILPVGPQVIQGTVNDAAPVPPPNPTHGSFHWDFERLVAIGLIPLTIAPFAAGSVHPVMDAVLGASLVIHSHIGFQACVIDYFPKRQYGTLRKAATWALNGATLLVLYGLYEYETNDVGITEGIKRVWTA
ncbi:hypothetical protein BJ508DRAFT_420046 [Ascobolus immersus RN42]|uniref:Succinate dehydrogenase [ubiquinone] cytochrome b small subunit n=1 Tax=Ascobolus immersus RN42 TaxID=1160509 RepID=A0A3N4HDA5_ASCIM|nr:hypothetical protein BJ508DRAFT_420046 [Ascobolus immersus RN42]